MNSVVTRRVTAKTHPSLFKALLEIDYDHGAVNRYEPERKFCDVPEPWLEHIGLADAEISKLTPEQLETLCCGDEDEAKALVTPYTHDLLNAYFNEWETD